MANFFQEKWLEDTIVFNLEASSNRAFTNATLAKNVKLQTLPVLKIFRFIKQCEDGSITAILADSHHKILVHFTTCCIQNYLIKYKQRLTYNTINSLVQITHFDLQFVNNDKLQTDFAISEPIDEGFLVVLIVKDLQVFQRDQIETPMNMKFVYMDTRYQRAVQIRSNKPIFKPLKY